MNKQDKNNMLKKNNLNDYNKTNKDKNKDKKHKKKGGCDVCKKNKLSK